MDYWIIVTGDAKEPGINGGLMPRHDPAQPCVNTVDVANLDEMLKTIGSQGGTCTSTRVGRARHASPLQRPVGAGHARPAAGYTRRCQSGKNMPSPAP
jgi:hypothetical protein